MRLPRIDAPKDEVFETSWLTELIHQYKITHRIPPRISFHLTPDDESLLAGAGIVLTAKDEEERRLLLDEFSRRRRKCESRKMFEILNRLEMAMRQPGGVLELYNRGVMARKGRVDQMVAQTQKRIDEIDNIIAIIKEEVPKRFEYLTSL